MIVSATSPQGPMISDDGQVFVLAKYTNEGGLVVKVTFQDEHRTIWLTGSGTVAIGEGYIVILESSNTALIEYLDAE